MPDNKHTHQASQGKPYYLADSLHIGPHKRSTTTDPLVSYGWHFGCTIHALANVKVLVTNGILCLGELAEELEEFFTIEQRQEHRVFQQLLQMVPSLEECIMSGNDGQIMEVAEHLQKGLLGARANDTKNLKGVIIDWITPPGQSLNPPIARNVKIDHRFNRECTGSLLCPAGLDWTDPETKAALRSGEMQVPGDQWPIFIYAHCEYKPEDMWKGAFRSAILVTVKLNQPSIFKQTAPTGI